MDGYWQPEKRMTRLIAPDYPKVCPNHHLSRHHIEHDYPLFVKEEEAKWNYALYRRFGPDPKAESAALFGPGIVSPLVGTDLDLMMDHILSKFSFDDLREAMLVCKGWGKAIASKFFRPNYKDRYELACENFNSHHYSAVLRYQKDLPPILLDFHCDCEKWQERASRKAHWKWWQDWNAEYQPNDYGERFNPHGAGIGYVIDYKEVVRNY